MNKLKIELHLLQNFPPSCLNRDDTNTPKTCEFGGVTRARVSSQCWKRAVREQFREIVPERRGTRSKRLKAELMTALIKKGLGTEETLKAPLTNFLTTFYAGMDKKRPEETNVLVFYSQAEFDTMVEVLSEDGVLHGLIQTPPICDKGKIEKRLKSSALSTDVALFARMLADAPGLNVEAACQVAHAISTHSVNLELDFFTAVDDLKDKNDSDDAGAGMLGTVGYDSACYYRYALVDDVQLVKNLNGSTGDADASLKAFLEAFCEAVPGAKRNSFAHGNPPFLAFFVVRRAGTPASLVNAFAHPVGTRNGDLLVDSALALAKQAGRLDACYELYTNGEEGESVQTFLAHTLEQSELPGLPTNENVPMRKAIAGVLSAVKAFREAQA
ncbi:MAG: CRISPR-associated protein Cse4 [Chthonomonadales bacterium]|nr:CRISPR-associated protein Cse4 [Chthonomonadales bacterium]